MSLSISCPYCHKYTELTRLSKSTGHSINNFGEITVDISWYNSTTKEAWWLGKCNSCKNVVLVLNEGDKIFPHPRPISTDERVPDEIRLDMDEAKLCFSVSAFKASVVMSRRVIQLTCIEKGAKKHRLVDQINEIADTGGITKDLKDWAHEVRLVGNAGAHPDDLLTVDKNDAEDILKLAEQFIQVIYVVPAIAKDVQKKRAVK